MDIDVEGCLILRMPLPVGNVDWDDLQGTGRSKKDQYTSQLTALKMMMISGTEQVHNINPFESSPPSLLLLFFLLLCSIFQKFPIDQCQPDARYTSRLFEKRT